MFQTITLRTALLATFIGVLGVAIPARASITFDGSGAADNTFQQTDHGPCVIGDPACSQPAGMTYFSSSGPTNPYDFFSPVYTATDPFTTFSGNLIPISFIIGIDDNLATGKGLEVLQAFNTYICPDTSGAGCALDAGNSYTGPTNIPNNNNGSGFSDATLKGFSLTAGTFYKFEASVSNDTDGMEEFFLLPPGTLPVPEPVSSALVGTGLIALFFVRRRIHG